MRAQQRFNLSYENICTRLAATDVIELKSGWQSHVEPLALDLFRATGCGRLPTAFAQQHTPHNGLRQSVQTVSVSIGRDIAGKVKVSPACECQCEQGHVGCRRLEMGDGQVMRDRVRIKLKRIFSLVEPILYEKMVGQEKQGENN